MATNLLGDIDHHVGVIMNEIHHLGIDRDDLTALDHLCYRVETLERYEEMKRSLGEIALMIAETPVQGRDIAIFELHERLHTRGWKIPYIELPQPKEGSPYSEGLEHAEFVVLGSLERFQQKYDRLPFDTKAMDRIINPELGLKTDRAAMKFHNLQIGEVVRIEAALRETYDISL